MLVALKRAVFGEQTVEGEIHVQGLYMMLKMTWSECKCDKISYVTRVNGPFPVLFAMFAGATFYTKKKTDSILTEGLLTLPMFRLHYQQLYHHFTII